MSNGLSKLVEIEGRPETTFEATHPPVIGVARPTSKVGILGVHKANGAAVAGFSESGEGVRAESEGNNGIHGVGALNGVVGETKADAHSGVLGRHEGGGRGVSGLSEAPGGIGIWGRGAHLAGKFEGDVEVTGKLSVGGEDLQERINVLEQQLREVLERLDATQPRIIIRLPQIGVIAGGVAGDGFIPNHSVTIRFIDGSGIQHEFSTTSNAQGQIRLLIGTNVILGPLFVAATDGRASSRDLTGKLWTTTIQAASL